MPFSPIRFRGCLCHLVQYDLVQRAATPLELWQILNFHQTFSFVAFVKLYCYDCNPHPELFSVWMSTVWHNQLQIIPRELSHRMMDFIPVENSDYHSINYWNQRFAQEENYEWCGGYINFQMLFNQYVPRTDSILIVGKLIWVACSYSTNTISVCFGCRSSGDTLFERYV